MDLVNLKDELKMINEKTWPMIIKDINDLLDRLDGIEITLKIKLPPKK